MKKILFSFCLLFICLGYITANNETTYYQNPAYKSNGNGHDEHGNGNGNGHENHGNGNGYGHDGKPMGSLPVGDGVYILLGCLGLFTLFVELRNIKTKLKTAD